MSLIAFTPRPYLQTQTDESAGNDVITNAISQRASLNNLENLWPHSMTQIRHESARGREPADRWRSVQTSRST